MRENEARARRAAQRKSWTVHISSLSEQPGDDLSSYTTPGQRLEMMWALAIEAWSLAGIPLPQYERGRAPIRVLVCRVGERGPAT